MTSTDAGGAGTLLDAHVRGYAEAVRLHLADLGPEVTEDLTDGLEADLAEAVQEAAEAVTRSASTPADDVALDLAAHFGPAADYAAELRSAAGLPPAGPPRRQRVGLRASAASAGRALRERWAERWRPVTSTPQWAGLRTLGREIRPVWWVARGWILGALLAAWLGSGTLSLVPLSGEQAAVMAAGALVSVQWARGRWLPRSWLPRVTVLASLVAVLAVPVTIGETRNFAVLGASAHHGGSGSGYDAGYQAGYSDAHTVSFGGAPGEDGVWVDGMQVSNLFAYDANGDPIRDVQLYDDRGRPVRTITDAGAEQLWAVPEVEGSWYFRPAVATDGRQRWNVYPLRAVPESGMDWSVDGEWEPVVGVRPEAMPWPFLKAPTAIPAVTPSPEDAAPGTEPSGPADEAPSSGEDEGGEPSPSESTEPERVPTPGPTRTQTAVVDASGDG